MQTGMTLDLMKRCAPKGVAKNITQEMVDNLNNLQLDPDFAESYRDNIIGFMNVMQDGKFKLEDYFNAVRYVSFKLMGDPNIKAFAKTFPDKYSRWMSMNVPEKQIHGYSSAYGKNKLVNLVLEQSIVPFHVYNQEMRQKALNTQAELMMYANSEKVRSDAANSVLTHTKGPEESKIELDVSVSQDSSIDDLRLATLELVKAQQAKIIEGSATARDVAHSKIIHVEEADYE